MAQKAADVCKEYGATRVVEAWGDDVPDGKVTDYKDAVKAKGDEKFVYSSVEWPSKQARDEAWPKIMAGERMQTHHANMPFDCPRMIYGGFISDAHTSEIQPLMRITYAVFCMKAKTK